LRLLWEAASSSADIYHIQVEYQTFGGVARSLAILPLLAALLRVRGAVVVTLHGLVTARGLRGRRLKALVLFAFQLSLRATGIHASAFVVHSEDMRKAAEREYGLHDVVVIPLGSDPVPTLAAGRKTFHHVVFFGFIRPEKGLEPLVEAIRKLKDEIPDIRLTVAGSVVRARERGYLETVRNRVLAEGLTENVRFLTKFLTDEEVADVMRDASVLALPYTDEFVEVSLIVHDLAGYGVPLICSTAPRFSELEDGVDCLKVAPEPNELAKAIRRVLLDPALAARLGEGLLARSRRESWDMVVAKHLELYREILRTGSPEPSSGT
jgi:glycosyltransferase involved in cell wall biosynthesis